MLKNQSKLNKFKASVIAAAKTIGVEPCDVTMADYTEYAEISELELRKMGGFKRLLKVTFPPQELDIEERYRQKDINSYVNKLEKQVAERGYIEKTLAQAIALNIAPVKVKPYKAPKTKKTKKTVDIVSMLNDIHIGLIVKPEEVADLNEYNFEIASRRIAYYINEVCNYKKYKRDQVDTLHFILNGDLVAGIIHGLTGRDLELLTHQFNGAVHILSNAVARLSENFKNVKVYFSTGNHGDHIHRREGHRVISQVYDSIEGMLFYGISAAHKNTKNTTFIASHSLYQDVQLPAGRAMVTHGHTLFSKQLGNPGSSINTRLLSNAVMNFNNGERAKGKEDVKLILFGHTHGYFDILTNDKVRIYNAPSLSGIDSYAFSLGINHNLVAQTVFESTPEHIMGDSRLIHVQAADKMKELDKIIPPYKYELISK